MVELAEYGPDESGYKAGGARADCYSLGQDSF